MNTLVIVKNVIKLLFNKFLMDHLNIVIKLIKIFKI